MRGHGSVTWVCVPCRAFGGGAVGAAKIDHPDLERRAPIRSFVSRCRTRSSYSLTRRTLLRSNLQSIEESIQGQQGLLQAYGGMLANRRNQLSLINEELGNLRGLVKEGYAPRNRQLEMERMAADSSTAIADLQGNTVRAQRAMAELRQRAISRQQEYRREVETQLADVSREVLSEERNSRPCRTTWNVPKSRHLWRARW